MNEEITLENLITKLKELILSTTKKWKLIVLFTIIGVISGIVYTYNLNPVYIAEMKILVKENKPTTFNGLIASNQGLNAINNDNFEIFQKNNIREFIKSRKIIQKTLSKNIVLGSRSITLGEMYQNIYLSENNKQHYKFSNAENKQGELKYQDSTLNVAYDKILHNCLKINQNDHNLQIFKIQMNSINELFSVYFLNNLAASVTEECLEMKMKNINLLKEEIDSLKNEINPVIKGGNTIKQINNEASLKTSTNEINERILYELIQELELTKLSIKKNPSPIEIIDNPILPLQAKKVSYIYAVLIGGIVGGFSIIITLIINMVFKKMNQK